MVSKKFSCSKIIMLFAVVAMVVFCGITARAEGPYSTEYEGYNLYFFKGDFTLIPKDNSSYSQFSFAFDNPDDIVTFIYNHSNSYVYLYSVSISKSPFVIKRFFVEKDNDTFNDTIQCTSYRSLAVCSVSEYDVSYLPYITSADSFQFICREFAYSGLVDNFKPATDVDYSLARNDMNYGLQNVKASCIDNQLTISWALPFSVPDDVSSMPILIDLLIEDIEKGESGIYYYPATESIYTRPSMCDVNDLSVSFDVGNIKDIPENFKIKSVSLTPYYVQHLEYLDMDITYKGQTSHVFLNYVGTDEKPIYQAPVIQTPPDTEIIEEDMPTSIFGAISNFFSGFFNNFGTMLKNLFIPTKEQFASLFNDMQSFFSEKLGFLWFPFDFAIEIVQAFTNGYQDSLFVVPPITINIMDGITLFEGGTFDMDAVGVFAYVRMLTSIILSCCTYELASLKWREFIEGENGE